MSDNPLPYRSATPVSARVDAAWGRGYEVGRSDGLRHLGIGVVGATWTQLRRAHLPALLVGLVVLLVALCVVPTCALVLAARRVIDYRRRAVPLTVERVLLDDGTVF